MKKIQDKIAYLLILGTLSIPTPASAQTSFIACSGVDCDIETILQTISNFIKFVLQISIAATALIFAYAGILYLTSGGNPGKAQKAIEMLKKTVIGFLFVLGAFLIVELITSTLGLKGDIIKLNR